MKKHFYFVGVLLFCSTFFLSCKDNQKKKQLDIVEDFKNSLTSEDTVQVFSLCNKCMETLKAGEIDQALSMLQILENDTVLVPLSAEKQSELKKNFKFFPVLDYKVESFAFNTNGLNDVRYSITFFEKEANDPTPNTIGFMFNPVKLNGQWYLTVKDAKQQVILH